MEVIPHHSFKDEGRQGAGVQSKIRNKGTREEGAGYRRLGKEWRGRWVKGKGVWLEGRKQS